MLAGQRFQTQANGGPGIRTLEEVFFEVSRKKSRLMLFSPFCSQPHLTLRLARSYQVAPDVLGDGSLRPSWLFSHRFFFLGGAGGAGLFYYV